MSLAVFDLGVAFLRLRAPAFVEHLEYLATIRTVEARTDPSRAFAPTCPRDRLHRLLRKRVEAV